jgi:enoyl-CoA hydratase
VVVLSGAGGHFCAGADLTTVEDDAFVDLLRSTLETMRSVPVPVIAAIEGAALGAGTQLALACDLRIATRTATFGIPAGRLGLTVDHWTVQQLARQVGSSTARAMLLGAEVYRGERLAANGFVHRLVDEGEDVDVAAQQWVSEVARLAPLTLAAHKAMLEAAEPADDAPDEVAAARLAAWRSEDLQEGLVAFGERRAPVFRGR